MRSTLAGVLLALLLVLLLASTFLLGQRRQQNWMDTHCTETYTNCG